MLKMRFFSTMEKAFMRLFLIGLVVVLIAACGGQPASNNTSPTPTVESSQGASVSNPADLNDVEYLDFTLDVSGDMVATISGVARTNEAEGSRLISFAPADYTYQA